MPIENRLNIRIALATAIAAALLCNISAVKSAGGGAHNIERDEGAPLGCVPNRSAAQFSGDAMARRPELIRELPLDNEINAMAWAPNGQRLVTSEKFNSIIKVWDVRSAKVLVTAKKQPASTSRILITEDGKFLITSSVLPYDGRSRAALTIFDVGDGQAVRNVDGPYDPSVFVLANQPRDLELSPDGKELYATFNTRDSGVHIFDTSTWSEIGSIPSAAFVMRAGPRADELVTVEADGTARVWNVRGKHVIREFPAMRTAPASVALAPVTCRVATGVGIRIDTVDQTTQMWSSGIDPQPIRIWDLNSGKQLDAGMATQPIRALAFNADETLLVAATGDNKILLFNPDDLAASTVIHQFAKSAQGAAFSPDGHYLAAAGDTKVVLFRVK